MASREQVEKRRALVQRYIGQGLSIDDMVYNLNVVEHIECAKRTVEEDKRIVIQRAGISLSAQTKEELATELWLKIKEQERLAITQYHDPLATLKDKRAAQTTILKLMEMEQSFFMPQGQTQVNVAIKIGDERCVNCPYKERFTKAEMRSIMDGSWKRVCAGESEKEVPRLAVQSQSQGESSSPAQNDSTSSG